MTTAPTIAVATTIGACTSGGETRRRTPSATISEPEDEQRDAVDLRGEDLGAPEAERHPAAGRPQREPRRPHAQPERGGVDEHVRGVREQRQRVGDDPEHHLGRHEGEDQDERDRERPGIGVGAHAVVVTVMVRHRP